MAAARLQQMRGLAAAVADEEEARNARQARHAQEQPYLACKTKQYTQQTRTAKQALQHAGMSADVQHSFLQKRAEQLASAEETLRPRRSQLARVQELPPVRIVFGAADFIPSNNAAAILLMLYVCAPATRTYI